MTTPHTFAAEMNVEYKDDITGFRGKATALAMHVTGCDRVCLEPPVKEDGTLPEACWFDDHRLLTMGGKPIVVKEEAKPGGPVTRGRPR